MGLHSSLGSGDLNPGLSFSKDTFSILLIYAAELPLTLGTTLDFLSWPLSTCCLTVVTSS